MNGLSLNYSDAFHFVNLKGMLRTTETYFCFCFTFFGSDLLNGDFHQYLLFNHTIS
jgi:hypothetical protein